MEQWKTSGELLNALGLEIDISKSGIPKFGVRLEGVTMEGHYGPSRKEGYSIEWELNAEHKVEHCRNLAKILDTARDEIIGWDPRTADGESENLPQWQEELFGHNLIPTDEDGNYCSEITDIQVYVIFRGLKTDVKPKKGAENE